MRLPVLAACLLALAGAPAHAQPQPGMPAEQAPAEASLRSTIADWLGNDPAAPAITPLDGGFRLAMPAGAASFGLLESDQALFTALASRTATGWRLDQLALTSPALLRLAGPTPMRLGLRLARQHGQAVFDANGESQIEANADGVDLTSESVIDGTMRRQAQSFTHIGMQEHRKRTADGRLDVMRAADATGWSFIQTMRQGTLRLAAATLHVAGHLEGLDPAALAAFAHLLADPASRPAAPDRAAWRQLLAALPGIAGQLQLEQGIDDLSGSLDDQQFGLAHLGLGLQMEAPGGVLATQIDLAVDGLAVPALPPEIAELMPRHIALRPSLAGLNLNKLVAALDDNAPPAARQGLFGNDGASLALDSFAFDLGPAALSGRMRLTIGADHAPHGTATISADGMDALIDKAGASPLLAQSMPLLLMLKGLGRPDGAQTVWELRFDGERVLVNGTDLSAMLGANAGAK